VKNLLKGCALGMVVATGAWADGDAKAGKKVFKKCKACHTVKEGKNKVGPSLYGIVGAPAAMVEGFKYTSALSEAGLVWDVETLTMFLAKPKDVVSGTSMAFSGLKDPEQIADLISYLKKEASE